MSQGSNDDADPASTTGPSPVGRWAGILACGAVIAGSLAVLVLARLPLAGALLLTVPLLGASWFLDRLRRPGPVRRAGVVALLAVVVAAAVALGTLFTANRVDGLAFALGIAIYLAVGKGVAWWRRSARWRPRRGPVVLAVVSVLGVGFVALAVTTEWSWPVYGVVAALLVAPVGLGLLAEDVVDRPWVADPTVTAIAVAAVAAGLAGLSLVGMDPYHAVGLVVALVVVVAAVSSAASHDIMLVVVFIGLLWSLEPQTVGAPPDPGRDRRTILALGDSYMSGEGASEYYAGTNATHDDASRNECRRAPTAYPVRARELLAEEGEAWELLFLACSGAKAHQLTTVAQYPGEPTSPWNRGGEEGGADDPGSAGQAQIPQAEAAVAALGLRPEVVIVQIGGNDAAFGEIGQTCGLPGDCSLLGKRWLDDLEHTREEVRDAYARVRAAFPDARVLVVPYPVPLAERGCRGSLLRPNEHRFLAGYTRALDRVLQEEAARPELDFDFLASNVEVLTRARRRVCDTGPGDAAVNELAASPVAGVLLQQASPRGWFHNTFHPNHRGHALVATDVAQWVADPPSGDHDPSGAPSTLEGIMGTGYDHCESTERVPGSCRSGRDMWVRGSIGRALLTISLPVLLVVGGAFVLAVGVMRRWREPG